MTNKQEGWETYACKFNTATAQRAVDRTWESFCMARNNGAVCKRACDDCVLAARMSAPPHRIWAGPSISEGWDGILFARSDECAGFPEYIRIDLHKAAVSAARAEAINRLLDVIGAVEGRGAANIRLAARKLRSQFISEASK